MLNQRNNRRYSNTRTPTPVSISDIGPELENTDPDVKQQLIAKAVKAQGGMVSQVMEQSKNPLMQALHPILKTMMGGDPADVSTGKDSKGKKTKTKTDYQGMDPDAYKSLMSDFFQASKNQSSWRNLPR